jgi:hypothetical protein
MSQGTKNPQQEDEYGSTPLSDELDAVVPTDAELAEEEANGDDLQDDEELGKGLPVTNDEGFESLEALRDKEEEEAEEEYNNTLQHDTE